MFDTTKDILFFTLAVCSACVCFFLCWFLFNAAKAVKQLRSMMTEVHDQLEQLYEKINSALSYMGIITQAVKIALGYFKQKKKNK